MPIINLQTTLKEKSNAISFQKARQLNFECEKTFINR